MRRIEATASLSSPYPWRWIGRDGYSWDAKATLSSGKELEISVEWTRLNMAAAQKHLEPGRRPSDKLLIPVADPGFYIDESVVMTGEGDAFRILATVWAVIKEARKGNPDRFHAIVIEPSIEKTGLIARSRTRLYQKLARSIAREWNWEYVETTGLFLVFDPAKVREAMDAADAAGKRRQVAALASDSVAHQQRGWYWYDQTNPEKNDIVPRAFVELGEQQRGKPERAMLRVQFALGGGTLNPVVEHVGDITHRMTELFKYAGRMRDRELVGTEFVTPKVDRQLSRLEHPYGFQREHEENIRANSRGKDVDAYLAKLNGALETYAREHRRLRVFNYAQMLARDAAITVGMQEWRWAINNLKMLQNIIKGPHWPMAALMYHADGYGSIDSYGIADGLRKPDYSKVRRG